MVAVHLSAAQVIRMVAMGHLVTSRVQMCTDFLCTGCGTTRSVPMCSSTLNSIRISLATRLSATLITVIEVLVSLVPSLLIFIHSLALKGVNGEVKAVLVLPH